MKILAIESSGQVASAAILQDDKILAEYTTNFKITHSQTLMPMISEICRMTETDLETLDAVAVSGGPGSFTGLRIGSATAKALAMAINKPVIHVPTLDAMAVNLWGNENLIVPIMDARRSQVYTGVYTFTNEGLKVLEEGTAMSINELLELIYTKYTSKEVDNETLENNGFDRFDRVVFLGDGVSTFKEVVKEHAKFDFSFAPANNSEQRAASVAVLAAIYYKEGKLMDADDEAPDYLRPSQAERERAEREK
ncbi:MAG: tRNA (adenosine(37)-N6)-threonylcarbamoyltransferase complex dimerization subunit type 1 TsaB [Lachnospiraceae bacterium]|nr:tRNA (adenosine(37)-N6)-threonylcarbamoyltransferase complex dimerization subunit type 1 TsaB [Lachnospiraceae bacterium]